MRSSRKSKKAGPFLRWLRKQNASELADRLGVTRQAVYVWVHAGGLPRPAVARKLLRLGAGEFTLLDLVKETYLVRY